MEDLWIRAAYVAPLDSTVLITGESGVGKERMARFLHEQSRRRQGPFIAVNCAAYADSLLDTELFGHARGAFTGAVQDRRGCFEAAHGGTLFLDEIGETSPALQVKLLRIVQERELRRVGETALRRVDVRLLAATHRNLRAEVAAGAFRADLFYRLCVIELRIPPLRERPEDLRTLASVCLERTAKRLGRSVSGYAPDAWACLAGHSWPGNVRELEHVIESACAWARGARIERSDLPECVRDRIGCPADSARAGGLRAVAHDFQRAYLLDMIERQNGDRASVARTLGISLSTLKRRLRMR